MYLNMVSEANHSIESEAVAKRWAWARIVLGWLQMAGAAASVVLLLMKGATTAAVIVVSVTAAFMVISAILFRVLKMPRSGRRSS